MDELENELTSSGDGQAIEQPQEPEGNTENNKSQTIEEVLNGSEKQPEQVEELWKQS